MNLKPCSLELLTFKRSAMALALTALSAGASALPSFTFDPGAVGLAGSAFTADNLLVFNYSTVTSAALAVPLSRGMTHACGSASLRW